MITFIKYWHFSPIIIVLLALLCFTYFYFSRGRWRSQSGYFIISLVLIVLSTSSPLHWLGENYLFSAHMISHILLFFIIPPLLILSIHLRPSSVLNKKVRKVSQLIARVPWLAWISGLAVMWFWHIPAIFDGAMSASSLGLFGFLHHIQGISIILVGLLFWWPVFGPVDQFRMAPLKGILYLFTACIGCSLLGLMITFAPVGEYTYYAAIPQSYGFAPLIRNGWGISTIRDRQIAGLIMWVPGCVIYLLAAIFIMKKWFIKKEEAPSITSMLNYEN